MSTTRTVLVSGAGIAGPALAFWLRRHGFTPTVVERAPGPRTGGYKIDLRGAAVEVARRMGILDDVRRADVDMRTMSFVGADGRRLATFPADLFMGRGEGDVELMRGDLEALLLDATRADVEHVFGDSITGLVQGPDGVEVTFERGAPRTFDLVVGADGLHSNVRALAFGDESRFVKDLGYGVAIVGVPNHLGLDREEQVRTAPGATVTLYSTGRDAAEAKAMFLFTAPAGTVGRRDVARQKEVLAEAFAGAGWETPRLLGSLGSAPDLYYDSISQVRMDGWTSGRVALVGDAGYCPSLASGQGTGMAMVGAYVLAGELAAADGDHVAAFAAYDRKMRPFVELNQKLGTDAIPRMVARSRFQSWIGVQAMRMLPLLPWRNLVIEKITGPVHDAATAITLEDYTAGSRAGA